MRRARRGRKTSKHISISATDADWEIVRRNADRRGLSIARYLVELWWSGTVRKRTPVLRWAGRRPKLEPRAPAELSPEPERGVLEAVARAVAHVAERRTAIPEAEIRAVALGHAPGRYTLAEVDAAIARLASGGELIEAERRGMDRAFVTDRAVRTERRVLASMRAGRGRRSALAGADAVEARLEASRLTRGQREAVRTVLLSNDLAIGVQGHAGSGKTTMLSEVRELLGERRMQGLAPSAVAARVLAREAGIPSRTLQYFLTRFGDLSDPERLARGRAAYGGAVLAVDEASMIDTLRQQQPFQPRAGNAAARAGEVIVNNHRFNPAELAGVVRQAVLPSTLRTL